MTKWFALLLFFFAGGLPRLAADDAEFFEKKIRPVLAEHCFKCHSKDAEKLRGGLRLDGREQILEGGDSGPAIVPGNAKKSRLLDAVGYANVDLQMPPAGKLPANVIADLETWIKNGAVWPGGESTATAKETFSVAKRRSEHWAWQPVKPQPPPLVRNEKWPLDAIDRFILSKLEAKNLTPAAAASKSVWLRRVTFALTGLPPTPEELAAFETDVSEKAFEKVADRLLASPAYGERWARHWLDLVRYAESRGHEHDPDIPNAWLFRDYVVRAFNQDVPYPDFVHEQICGHGRTGRSYRDDFRINESVIGTAFWRLGEEAHSPVDIRADQADRFDNRIDVFGKTFFGLTIACARCHDHKFDAISTKDYYSLFALLNAGSDTPVRTEGRQSTEAIQANRVNKLQRIFPIAWPSDEYEAASSKWKSNNSILVDYSERKKIDLREIFTGGGSWDETLWLCNAGDASLTNGKPAIRREPRAAVVFDRFWEKLINSKGPKPEHGKLGSVSRAGLTVRSPLFKLEKDSVYLLVRGGGVSFAAVGNHTLIDGPLHAGLVQVINNSDSYRWVKHPLKDYLGLTFRMELTADPKTDFAVAMIVQSDHDPSLPPAIEVPPVTTEQEKEALAKFESLPDAPLMGKPEPVWESKLVPGVIDGASVGEHVFIRGNPRTLGEHLMPRMLQAFYYVQEFPADSRHMLQHFARQVVDYRNPLLNRVLVNRLWHHLFGRGIVASTDNFGVLGERPTHPELLDYLATEFVAGGHKIKPFLKRLVLSQTYRMSSLSADDPRDPANHLLHHFRIKRLEGEAIRDAMLAVSGRLDRTVGGTPVPMHLTEFLDGRGRPAKSGPLDGDGRRSIYLAVRRNFLSPFLLAFDTPIPQGTVGTRQVSNVPAQALILMNDSFVHDQAKVWGTAMEKMNGSIDDRIARMYRQAFARPPSPEELKACREFLGAKPEATAWSDFAHSLFNVKEFRYVP